MEYFEKLKQSFVGSDEEVAVDRETVEPPVTNSVRNGSWNTFVDQARSTVFPAVLSEDVPAKEAVGEQAADDSTDVTEVVSSTVKSWWDGASSFMEEAKISMEEKISEMTGPSEIKNDPLRKYRDQLVVYVDALEELKCESFNFAMTAENFARLSSPGLGRLVTECFNGSVVNAYQRYTSLHEKTIKPALDEIHSGSDSVTALISEEIGKVQLIQTRFKRRDRLHRTLLDMRARVEIRREKNNRQLVSGGSVDAKSVEELYEVTRSMDSIESDFRSTSEQLVNKCVDLLSNRSESFLKIFQKVIETQNTFYYRISTFSSVPFQELVESIRNNEVGKDQVEQLGPHALTWRSHNNSDDETTKPPIVLNRRASVEVYQTEQQPTQGEISPSRFSYRRDRQSPIRRSGTTALTTHAP